MASQKSVFWFVPLIICTILVGPPSAPADSGGVLGAIVRKLGPASELVLEKRCDYYFGTFSANALKCRKLGKTMLQELGQKYELEGKGFNFIVYEKDMLSLLRRADVQNYLRELSANPSHISNLYDWTLSHAGGDQHEAIRWLGVLFEDLSVNVGSVPYLKAHYASELGSAIDLLAAAIRTLQSATFPLYPSSVEVPNSNAIYHFYVSAYATDLLKKEQNVSEKWAAFDPFLMNLVYGIIFHHCLPNQDISDVQVLLKLIAGKFDGCWNVKSLSTRADAGWLANTYLAYAGAQFANRQSQIQSEANFSKDISRDVRAFVRSWVER